MTINLAAFEVGETLSTTEHSFTTDTAGPDAQTTAGVYQFFIDLNALATGDVYIFRIYEKVLAAGTQRLVWKAVVSGAQNEPVLVTPTLLLGHGFDLTGVKVSGTDRLIQVSTRVIT